MTIAMKYPFTEAEFKAASDAWGCNCGPSALAFATQKPLEAARHAIPGFEAKRYTSPTMMRDALAFLGVAFDSESCRSKSQADVEHMFKPAPALVRIQWTGPWTAVGANAKWAYRQTHWIVAWNAHVEGLPTVFDCNGGVMLFREWDEGIVPVILKHCVPRSDGGWYPTHIWRLREAVRA